MRKLIGSCNHVAQYDLREHQGRIFFVSDLHGHYDLLHEALRDVAFDSSKDLLFSGGDWTDRGPDSQYVLDYLTEPWVHSVRGNHEEMFIEGFQSHWNPSNRSVLTLKAHGGNWIWGLDDMTKILIHDVFSSLPLGIELMLPNDTLIGIIHAEVPYNDWNEFLTAPAHEIEWNDKATAQWARTWYNQSHQGQVKGVDFVLVGHTPTESGGIEKLGNMIFTDGGAPWNRRINFIELNEDFIRRMK